MNDKSESEFFFRFLHVAYADWRFSEFNRPRSQGPTLGTRLLRVQHNASDVLTLFALCLYTGYIVFSGARRCNGAQVVMIVLE